MFQKLQYIEELENGFVDNKDFEVFSIKDVFLEEHINTLKHHYKRFEHYYVTVGYAGQRKWVFNYPEITQRLEEVVSKGLGEKVRLVDAELCVYAPEFGYEPKLYPHFDNHAKDGQTVTVSIELDSNIDWNLVVENKKYKTNFNEGVVFSGTQQIHWREKYKFNKLDYCAAVFAHFKYENNRPLSPNQDNIMRYWEVKYQQESGIVLDPVGLSEQSLNNWGGKDSWEAKVNEVFQEGKQ
jgi:hypothetical protein